MCLLMHKNLCGVELTTLLTCSLVAENKRRILKSLSPDYRSLAAILDSSRVCLDLPSHRQHGDTPQPADPSL